MKKPFYGVDVDGLLKIKGNKGYGVSIAAAKGGVIETYCSGSGRYGEDFTVNPDMIFQAASVSKPVFAMTLLRYVDKGIIDLDADISGVVSDFAKGPLTFPALLSHTAGYSVHGFLGYRADAPLLSLEDVVAGRGNSPKVCRIKPYGKQYMYSGGGVTLAELAFTRLTGTTLREAFAKEITEPLEFVENHKVRVQEFGADFGKAAAEDANFPCEAFGYGLGNHPRHEFWKRNGCRGIANVVGVLEFSCPQSLQDV